MRRFDRTFGSRVSSLAARLLLPLALLALFAAPASAQILVRIGTGGPAGTYFPIGRILADAVSAPAPGTCAKAGECGVPGLIAVAQLSNGSIANVEGIRAGTLEAALAQSDVVYWAYNARGTFAGKDSNTRLRFLAFLYPESLHLVVSQNSDIQTVGDLRDHRISLDEAGSGTIASARVILAGYGMSEADLKPEYLKANLAAERMREGRLDGFLFIAGWPTSAIRDFATSFAVRLVPISGPEAEAVRKSNPFLIPGLIPAGTYAQVGDTPTLDVGAQLVVSAVLDDDLVYAMTRELWSPRVLALLSRGHPKGATIAPSRALLGAAIPIHPGAQRFYREQGMLD